MNIKKLILLIFFYISLFTSLLPQNVYFIVLFSILVWILLPLSKWWDNISIALLLFSAFYSLIILVRGLTPSGSLLIAYMISPLAFYRFGSYLANEYTNDKERFRLILLIVIVYLFQMFSLTLTDIGVTGIVNETRALLGHSIENDALSATLYGLMSSVGIGCIGATFTRSIPLRIRILFISVVLMSLLTVIHLVNRTGVILMLIGVVSILIYKSNFKFSKFLFYLVIASVILGVIYYSGVISPEITSAYQAREAHDSYEMSTAGGRTEVWQSSFYNLFTSPIGWQFDHYSHNMWLDIARVGGWIPFIAFIIATCFFIKKLNILVKRHQSNLTLFLFSLNIVTLVAASVEPVIDGSISFFVLLLLIWGFTTSIATEHSV